MKSIITTSAIVIFLITVSSFADELNLTTGEYHMDMGGGDSMNLETGEYYMDMGE